MRPGLQPGAGQGCFPCPHSCQGVQDRLLSGLSLGGVHLGRSRSSCWAASFAPNPSAGSLPGGPSTCTLRRECDTWPPRPSPGHPCSLRALPPSSSLVQRPEKTDSLAGEVLRLMGPSAQGRDNRFQDQEARVPRTSADTPSTRALGQELLVLVTACSCPLTPICPYWDGARGTKVDRTPVMSGGLVGLRPLHWAPLRAQPGCRPPCPPPSTSPEPTTERKVEPAQSGGGAELPLSYLP